MKVGIIGATGYAGQQLVGLLMRHPKIEIEFLSSYSYEGEEYSEVYGFYRDQLDMTCINLNDALDKVGELKVLFLALPHGKSLTIIDKIKHENVKIIDFGADFRLDDKGINEEWYDIVHKDEELLKSAVYGLPELNRTKIRSAKIIANPGCYPTAAILGLLPVIDQGFVDPYKIIIDAKSGVSGAGRKANLQLSYCETNENLKAYAVGEHRHTPEIEHILSAYLGNDITISFTPHLVPMQRGIITTIYIDLIEEVNQQEVFELYEKFYVHDEFVRISKSLPETKHVSRTNCCDISLRIDRRTNRLIIISAIDNLVKGSAGEAIQNMNLMFDFPEWMGLRNSSFHL